MGNRQSANPPIWFFASIYRVAITSEVRFFAFSLSVALKNNRPQMTQDLSTWNILGPLGKN
jgi:hypothetical protein